MANYDSNYAIAQEISARIGVSPIPFDSVYSIALEIYNELGGEPTQFDSVYSILLGILPLVEGGIASKVIDDNIIALDKTWSSSKINEEIQAVGGTADSEFDGKTTEDFRFVTELPQEATEGEQVVIKGENIDTLYKYVSGAWVEQTPDATVLYFDIENEALYSYVSSEQQFATISSVNTIVVGKNLNTSEALKAIKTPGTYSVLQRTSSTTKGEYTRKWTLTVEGIDYEEYELTDSIYQRIQSNYTIQKRTWSSTRTTNNGWTNFSTYYAGEIKDSTTSKYYTWSSSKLNDEFALVDEKLDNIDAIINVDALPHAEINNRKIMRYNKHLYYSKPEEIEAVKFKALEDGSSVGLTKLSTHQTLQYSINGETWNTFDTTTSILLNNGESVFVRGILNANNTPNDYTQFTISGKVVASGNINLLWDYEAENLGSDFSLKQFCGARLFQNCVGLVDVRELYLPSTGGAGACYSNMFNGCTNLTSAQEILPLDLSFALACEYMYTKTAIEVAPVILSTNIGNSSVVAMFQPAPQTVSPLKYIKCLATSIGTAATKNWVRGVQTESGTFVKVSSMSGWETGNNGIPSGWTVVNDDTVPEYTWHNAVIYNWYEIPEGSEINDSTTSKYYTWSSNKITAELANIPQLEAGQNIEIADNKIAAKGYFYDDEPKEELKLIDDILHEAGMPPQMSLGLNVSGAAGTTTYTYTDAMGGTLLELIQYGMLPGVGATYKTANGKNGVIAAVDATTITFEETLDADNALTNEPVDYVVDTTQLFSFAEGMYDYVEGDVSSYGITLSGAAGATTYTYSSESPSIASIYNNGAIFKLQDNRSAKSISFDETNHTITFESTFDADNALSGALVISILSKNIASGKYSHTEGGLTLGSLTLTNTASGAGSHAEGGKTTASGIVSHVEGYDNTASGNYSHAEGRNTTASEEASHTEGYETTASGNYSHAEGRETTTQNYTEHAEGYRNVSHKVSTNYGDAGNTQHSIGISRNQNVHKNAFEIMQNGDMYVYGVGGYQGTDTHVQEPSIKTLQAYLASLEARINALEGNTTVE